MREDTVVRLRQPGTFSEDPLTEILRLGARRLLAQAVEMEVAAFVEAHSDLTDEAGLRRIVRHGYLPEREIQTGIGPVAVRCPRVRDRGAGETGSGIRFSSAILPRYLRRSKSLEELLPWLYLTDRLCVCSFIAGNPFTAACSKFSKFGGAQAVGAPVAAAGRNENFFQRRRERGSHQAGIDFIYPSGNRWRPIVD